VRWPDAPLHSRLMPEQDLQILGRVICRASRPASVLMISESMNSIGGCYEARGVPEVGVSCCVLILVDQSTEDIAATQPAEARRTPCFDTLRRHRRA
jgi:hypothetical protein